MNNEGCMVCLKEDIQILRATLYLKLIIKNKIINS